LPDQALLNKQMSDMMQKFTRHSQGSSVKLYRPEFARSTGNFDQLMSSQNLTQNEAKTKNMVSSIYLNKTSNKSNSNDL
jgi:hypothetical protein